MTKGDITIDDLITEMRKINDKLSEQIEHHQRRFALIDRKIAKDEACFAHIE